MGGMNILFYGRGAVATLYGWALEKAGNTVAFWDQTANDQESGGPVDLELLDARLDSRGRPMTEAWSPVVFTDLPSGTNYELIVVSVRHDRLELALSQVARVGIATVLVFGNVWADPKSLVAIPEDRLVWGYPSSGGGFNEGTLRGALMAPVHFGTFGADIQERGRSVRAVFTEAGFRVVEHRDFLGWLWLQFVVGAGLASQGLEAGSVSALIASSIHLKKAIFTIRELFPVVAARGIDLRGFSAETGPFRFPAWLGGWILHTTLQSQEAVRIIWEEGDEEERQLVCGEVLAEARRLGVPVPRLEALEPLFTPS